MKTILLSIVAVVVCVLIAGAIFLAGAKAAASVIQSSCDSETTAQTVINGHQYFCMDFTSFQNAIAALQHQRGA